MGDWIEKAAREGMQHNGYYVLIASKVKNATTETKNNPITERTFHVAAGG